MLAPWQDPKPTTFALSAGEVIVPYSIEYAIDDAAGVELVAFAAATALGSGMYEAAGYTNAGTAGRRTIRWRMKVTSTSSYVSWSQAWDTYRVASANPVYALVSDLRDEGITSTTISDARALSMLLLASIEVGRYTGRIFGAHAKTLMLNGRNGPMLMLDEPIIAATELVIGAESATSTEQAVNPSSYRVYNRHVSEMLTMPDDRENPKIEFRHYGPRNAYQRRVYPYGDRSIFVEGQQNVRLAGVFGYTDYDGSPAGGVPMLITRATMLIAARLSPKIGDPNTGFGDSTSWKVVEEQTRDQRVRFADLGSTAAAKSGTSLRGAFTGDPEIDNILAMYARGPVFAAV